MQARHGVPARLAGEGVRLRADLRLRADAGRHRGAHRAAVRSAVLCVLHAARREAAVPLHRRGGRARADGAAVPAAELLRAHVDAREPPRRTPRPRPGWRCGNGPSTTPTSHPMGGGFDAYRGNKFTYKLPVAHRRTAQHQRGPVRGPHRPGARLSLGDFEMLGEQGWPGLVLWLWIHVLGPVADGAHPPPLEGPHRAGPALAGAAGGRAAVRRRSSTWSARCSRASPTSRSS